jgi:hypothetical protein
MMEEPMMEEEKARIGLQTFKGGSWRRKVRSARFLLPVLSRRGP